MRPGVRQQEVCSARFTCLKRKRPCELDVYSDSTAGRGMCQRTGVGKVRHLGIAFLVDSGTTEVESETSEQRDD